MLGSWGVMSLAGSPLSCSGWALGGVLMPDSSAFFADSEVSVWSPEGFARGSCDCGNGDLLSGDSLDSLSLEAFGDKSKEVVVLDADSE